MLKRLLIAMTLITAVWCDHAYPQVYIAPRERTLIIYFFLTQEYNWEFMTVQRAGDYTYCEMLRNQVKDVFRNKPGNQKIVCIAELEFET